VSLTFLFIVPLARTLLTKLSISSSFSSFTGWLSGPPSIGTFAHYTRALAHVVARIPKSLSYTDAAVLPVAVGTAAAMLYESNKLALPVPSLNSPSPKHSEVLFVWGGSTSVGTSAIQLARASGFEVYSSASASNLDYLRSLGCTQVFDRTSSTLVQDVLAALEREGQGKKLVGLVDTISNGTFDVCRSLAKATGLALVVGTNPRADGTEEAVEYRNVHAATIKKNEVGAKIFRDFLEPALAKGEFKCLPEAEVVGKGLEAVQDAIDRLAAGVSAKKMVVELE
jgi:NADPH:quinone reductase-like Zn-dependent oxidoreductase